MKVSIITVSFNSAATIEDTIKSVLGQTYPNVEYIIVDGGSKDDTLHRVDKYKSKIARVVSEPDKGIYDAMNKGISLATGDILGIINSDDLYANSGVIEKIVLAFKEQKADAIYGDLVYVKKDNIAKVVRWWPAGVFLLKKLRNGWIPPHPSLFVKRSVYESCGLFDINFKIAADYEFILRCMHKGIRFGYVPEVLVKMREGGFSGQSFKQRRRGWKEIREAWRVNGLAVPRLLIVRRLVGKITQYI